MLKKNVIINSYQAGDEEKILPLFNEIFYTNRSQASWQWKFKHNPYGGPYVSIAWYDQEISAHYAAYPVPIKLNGQTEIVYQVGDTFTVPKFRKVGHGSRSLLAQVVEHFHQHYCEQKIPFFYGFNRGNIQKLGKLFLRYEVVEAVYDWVLNRPMIETYYSASICYRARLLGFSVTKEQTIGPWADAILMKAEPLYGSMIERNSNYLQWRYDHNPEYKYDIFVLKQFSRPIAWCVLRIEENNLILGDALFSSPSKIALQAMIFEILKYYKKNKQVINEISAWFSSQPQWWSDNLLSSGFIKNRQKDKLDLCITPFLENFNKEEVYQKFYFSKGDSDLF